MYKTTTKVTFKKEYLIKLSSSNEKKKPVTLFGSDYKTLCICKILLLEAGPEEPDVTEVPSFNMMLTGSSIDWMDHTQPERYACRRSGGRCTWNHGKVKAKIDLLSNSL